MPILVKVTKRIIYNYEFCLQDGTHLNDVASQLKQMSIMHILGTSVDSPVPQQESKVSIVQ